jgi:hypothetical protein
MPASCSWLIRRDSPLRVAVKSMHFHIFIVISFLVLYFDWLPIVAATAVIALHHVVGNFDLRGRR